MKRSNQTNYPPADEFTMSVKTLSEPDDEMTIFLVTEQRGFMRAYRLIANPPFPEGFPSGFDAIDRVCFELRRKLEILDLPTDQTPLVWDESEETDELSFIPALRWLDRIFRSTEPLSEGRVAGELLSRLIHLRAAEGLEKHLSEVVTLMELYANCRVAEINALAASGEAGNVARAAGPAARRSKAQEIREIVWRHTRSYWSENPNYLNSAFNTAQQIASQVRADLDAAGLLPKSGRSEKTIADDIREGIKVGVFQIGHSGASNGQSGI